MSASEVGLRLTKFEHLNESGKVASSEAMPELSENETPTKIKHRKKKNRETHNAVERHRKTKINSGINRIGELIPCSPILKQSKNMILDQAFKYINELKRQNDELLLNGGDKEQADEILRLRKQLSDIQKENARYIELLKANDICLYDDPTIHWRGNLKNAKVPLIIPTEGQKNIIVYSNGSPLGVNNQSVSFNVSQNLQKQTANVVPVQRTCNLVTPATVASVHTTQTKVWPQGTVCTSTSHQQIPLCLPVTVPAQAILKISTSEGEPNIVHAAVTNSHELLESGTAGQLLCVSRSAPQSNQTVLESTAGQQNGRLTEIVVSQVTTAPVLHHESPSVNVSCSGFQESFVVTLTEAASEQSPQASVSGNFQSTSVNTLADVTNSGRLLATSAVAETLGINTLPATTISTLPASCLDSGWSLPSSLLGSGVTAGLTSSCNLTRIAAIGNTQTTWTTLQVAGNTVQPLSRKSRSNLPVVSNEPVNGTGSVPATSSIQKITGTSLNNTLQVEGHPAEQVVVTLPSCPSLTVQPLVAPSQIKTQPAKSMVSLNPAMQVFQMAPPMGSAVTAAPANQNVIILHPPNPLPCPPVVRAEVPTQTVGQQIVIIQASPNANPLPLLSTQTPGPVRLPIQGSGPLVSTNSPVHNAPTQQTFGSKHLVHILPRPSNTSAASGSSPSFSVTMTSQQQPPTISLNGQLFALQPMRSSPGTAQQTPLQFIQPTTSEDPNTNVALNTFGALASLSQSISQMAGPSCVQLSINQAAIPSAPASSSATPTNCIPLSTTATTALTSESLSALQSTSNAAKPLAGLSATVKCKRTNKKTSTKKRPASSKETPQMRKGEDASIPDPASLGASKSLPNTEKQCPSDTTSQTTQSPAGCQLSTVTSVTGVSNSDHDSLESSSSELRVGSISEGGLHGSTVHNPLLVKSSGEGQFLSTSVCKDPILLAKETPGHEAESQPGSSLQAECSKRCIPVTCCTPPSTVNLTVAAPLSEPLTDQSNSNSSISEVVSISEPNISRQDHSSIMQAASDLLEGQGLGRMLYEIAKEKSSTVQTTSQVQSELQHLSTANPKSTDSDDDGFPAKIMSTETENLHLEHNCVAEQEVVVSTSLVHSRQADSPMSTSSGSNHSFSVASMLPDTAREEVTNSTPLTHVFNVCTSSEQTDIVALAARAIFDQGNAEKRKACTQVDMRAVSSETTKDSHMGGNVHQTCTQTYSEKGREQFEAQQDKTHSQDSSQPADTGGSVESPSCSIRVEASGISLQTAAQNTTSLSINNLIHPDNVNHSFVSCSNSSQLSEQIATTTTVNFPRPLVSYDNQSPAPAVATEYSHDQIHAFRTTVMQASQAQEVNEEQNRENRKESSKRPVQEDHHLINAKRQKLCESAPIRHDRMSSIRGASDDFVEHTQMLVGHMSHNSSNSVVSLSSHVPTNSFNTLFQTNVTFVNSALRQTDIRSNSQSVLLDHQQGQPHNQHLQQRVSNQPVNHLHSSNLYLKQQQGGQLRERPPLYQQHHNPHADSSLHSQSHNAHQQRAMQQEVQMQKKRNVGQGGQTNPLSLQQKHHGSDQGRPKGNHTHPHHHQQMQQQMQQHFTAPQGEKNCDNPAGNRNHHGAHQQSHLNADILHQQEVGNRQQSTGSSSEHVTTHNQLQRLMTSRSLEQHMVSQPSIVSRQSNMTCTPHRQERNRVSSYSAEALIGKTSNSEQRMGLSNQSTRLPDQLEMRTYLDVSRTKGLPIHNMQNRIPVEHAVADVQRISDCQSYKPGNSNHQATATFELQTSRNSEIGNAVAPLRGMQSQTFRIGQNSVSALDRQKRLPYAPVQGIPIANAMQSIENSCHQSFMQSLLGPHLGEPVIGSQRLISEHQRNTQCGVSTTLEYSCPSGRESVHLRRDSESQNRESCDMSMGAINSRNNSLTIPFSSSSSSGEVQGRNTSPHISVQKSNPMRITESQGSKSQLTTNVSSNVHGIARPSHPTISHGNGDQGQTPVRQSNPPITQRSRHPLQDHSNSKVRQPERTRSNSQRHGNVFDPSLPPLPLAPSSSMILGRQPSSAEKRASIVRFMSDGSQVPNDNTGPDQHTLSQNFGFPFIPDGSMNPTINANTAFIPPVTQSSATRTSALIPVDPQNTLPSFYPPYSPAHPSLSNDLSIPYFSNQMFTNPSTEKPNSASLNNRFGSILSPPRPVGFAQPSFPLLPDMPPMHMANPSHLSNFNLTSLFPEIATALPPDGSAMSPLLSIVNSATSDSSKQSSNRPAHNISHILGHDCSSAV